MKKLLFISLLAVTIWSCKKSSNDESDPSPSSPGTPPYYGIKGTWVADSLTRNDTVIASGAQLTLLSRPLTDSIIISAANYTCFEYTNSYVYSWDTLTTDTIKIYSASLNAKYGYSVNQNSLIIKVSSSGNDYKYYYRRK